MISVYTQNKQCCVAESSILGLLCERLAQYSSRKSKQWYFSRRFQCDKAVLPVYFMVDVAYICCKHLVLSLMAACHKCVSEDCGWVWDMMVPLSAGGWFDISLPRLMDGLLAEAGGKEVFVFLPSKPVCLRSTFPVFTCQIQMVPARVKEHAPSAPASVRSWSVISWGALLSAVWVFPVTARRNNDIYPTQQNPMFLDMIWRLLWKLPEFHRSNSLKQ